MLLKNILTCLYFNRCKKDFIFHASENTKIELVKEVKIFDELNSDSLSLYIKKVPDVLVNFDERMA